MKHVGVRVAWFIPTLLIVSFLVFTLLDLAPGDPARSIAGPDANAEVVAEIRESLHLDEPLVVRYTRWVGNAARGDLGNSLVGNRPVTEMVLRALPASLSIAAMALLLAAILAAIVGIAPIMIPRRGVDRLCTVITAVLMAVPAMWLAFILVRVFALDRSWFPAVGYVPFDKNPWQWFLHVFLPAISLAGVAAGELARQVRGSLRDVMRTDYILAARAKGLPRRRVVLKHGLKNAATPVLTVLGVRMGQLLAGTVVVEEIFFVNGIGRLTVAAVLARDLPVVLGVVAVTTTVVLVLNLLVDLSYSYFNPRLRSR